MAGDGPGEQAARMHELGRHFDELGDMLVSAQSGPPSPDRVVRFAARAVPHTQHSALTLVRGRSSPAGCVAETSIRSMFSLRLFLSGDERAALNFYAERPNVFDDPDIAVGAMFAPFAALAVQNAVRAEEIENLQTALRTSRQVGVAIGVLMARHLVTYDQAFAELVAASQHLNRKLRDIALEVVDTGQLPDELRSS